MEAINLSLNVVNLGNLLQIVHWYLPMAIGSWILIYCQSLIFPLDIEYEKDRAIWKIKNAI